jgi:hypothetical protein
MCLNLLTFDQMVPLIFCWLFYGLKLFIYIEILCLLNNCREQTHSPTNYCEKYEDLGKDIHYPILVSCFTEMKNLITQPIQNQKPYVILCIIVKTGDRTGKPPTGSFDNPVIKQAPFLPRHLSQRSIAH